MKVALITNYWKDSQGGGIKTYLVNLVNEIQSRGIEVNVLFREGVDPQQFNGEMNKMWFSWSCFNQLRKIRPDVIHSQGTWYCLLPGFLYKKFNKCKLIHTFHTEPVNKLPILAKIFFQSLLNACDDVTFVSNGLKTRVEDIDGLKFRRAAITYAGARANDVSSDEIQRFYSRYHIKQDDIILLATGMSSHPLKAQGLIILFQAIKTFVKNHNNILLIVIGKGQYDEELVDFQYQLGIRDSVIFTGHLDNPFIPLKICDIYTHITLGDGLPIALLEAMAMGVPVIATPIGGIPEAIVNGENGILVEPNAEIIADQLIYMINNKDIRDNLGIKAESTVREKFTWEKAADDILRLYTN